MAAWFSTTSDNDPAAGRFGPLEWRVLEAMWQTTAQASVRDLQPLFTDIAYTTLMTTLDRLFRKGVLVRTKQGRAYYYAPRLTRPEFESARAATALRTAIACEDASLVPLMSFFVQAVSDHDRELLDDLEALVRARRAELSHKP